MENLAPSEALNSLAKLLKVDRSHLVAIFPELEGYRTGRVSIFPIEDGNFRITGDLATDSEQPKYFSPSKRRFYSDRAKGIEESPGIVELPQKINVLLEKEPGDQPLYLVRDFYRGPEMNQEMPAGVVRAMIKNDPDEEHDPNFAIFDTVIHAALLFALGVLLGVIIGIYVLKA